MDQGLTKGSARALLFTLLGEFVFPAGQPVWTSTLVQVMTDMGVAEVAARQAIARAGASGWIEGVRSGRRRSWSLTPAMTRLMDSGTRRLRAVTRYPDQWDGRWIILSLSVPETRREIRPKLQSALRWSGFGNPTPGLWVSPHADRLEELQRIVDRFGLKDETLAFVGPSLQLGLSDRELVARAWDLEQVAAHYQALHDRFRQMKPRDDESTLAAHIQLVHHTQQMPFEDPGLPAVLLPRAWKGQRLSERLDLMRREWSPTAHAHWQRLAAGETP